MKTLTQILRFCAGGAAGVLAFYIILYVQTEWLHVWYVASSVIASSINYTLTFLFHKFWTFDNKEMDPIYKQFGLYVTRCIVFAVFNALALWLLVTYAHLPYLVAQLPLTVILSAASFFVTRWIFRIRPAIA